MAEPVIQQQGLDRIVVQLPGVQDTAKAKDIVRMSVARSAKLEPLQEIELPVNKAVLVIGGGLVLLGFLEWQRSTFAWKCTGLDADHLRRVVGVSTMTIGGLLKHMTFVEQYWFRRVLHGADPLPPWDTIDWATDREVVTEVSDRGDGTIRVPSPPWRFAGSDVRLTGEPRYRGEDNRAVLGELLGLTDADLDRPTPATAAAATGAARAAR